MLREKIFNTLKHRPELLAVAALGLLLLYNAFFTRGFFTIEIRDGHLFGVLIDIVKRASPLMFLSL